jgi:hypothetical protein
MRTCFLDLGGGEGVSTITESMCFVWPLLKQTYWVQSAQTAHLAVPLMEALRMRGHHNHQQSQTHRSALDLCEKGCQKT